MVSTRAFCDVMTCAWGTPRGSAKCAPHANAGDKPDRPQKRERPFEQRDLLVLAGVDMQRQGGVEWFLRVPRPQAPVALGRPDADDDPRAGKPHTCPSRTQTAPIRPTLALRQATPRGRPEPRLTLTPWDDCGHSRNGTSCALVGSRDGPPVRADAPVGRNLPFHLVLALVLSNHGSPDSRLQRLGAEIDHVLPGAIVPSRPI